MLITFLHEHLVLDNEVLIIISVKVLGTVLLVRVFSSIGRL